ncbi:MAG: histidine--tRNA ligase [Thermoleophilia bacterium]
MSQRRLEAPRGTRDVLPDEHRLRDHVVATAARLFTLHGYGHISTPTFEHTEVFARGVGDSTDIVRKEMYTFDDRGGRSITLRPEGTAGVVRAFLEHGMHKLPLPVKLWYTGSMFRYEAPQAGRFREHVQLGVEAIGSTDPLLDAEVITMLHALYTQLGVPDVRLRVGTLGDAATRGPYRERLIAHLQAADLPEDARERMHQNPMRLFDSKDPRVQAVMADAPRIAQHLGPEAAAHHATVLAALDAAGVPYQRDDTLVRGLDYYTHTVFEFTCDRLGAQSGIGGGGRYDGLVQQLGGPEAPGIGFGTGIERIVLALQAAELAPPDPGVDVYVAALGEEARAWAFPLIARLRARGLSCATDFGGRGLKGMMRHAAGLGARRTVILGEREFAAGTAAVRDMAGGEQREVPLDELEAHL